MYPFASLLRFEALVNWVAFTFFGFTTHLSNDNSGSGDKTFDYIHLFMICICTLILAPLFTFLFRKKRNLDKLQYWFTVSVRYYIAYMMMVYGFSKVFRLQMGPLGLERLMQPYGESTPMSLAWSFMGHSGLYCVFAGLMEVIAGLLLFFRRTSVFGAIMVACVMLNVMMMNYGYDIPVKLFSTQLVMMSVYLLSQHTKRLWKFFFSDEPVEPIKEYVFIPVKKWEKIAKFIIKGGFTVLAVGFFFLQSFFDDRGSYRAHPLRGIYTVKTYLKNNIAVPPLATDTTRWKYFIIGRPTTASIRLYNDSARYFVLKADTVLKKMTMERKGNGKTVYSFDYTLKGKELTLKGLKDKDTLEITFSRRTEADFPLVSRGFHWINEVPYNR
jgi:uncharacterized membrane protein YphA (DoxX/SURF4 family)